MVEDLVPFRMNLNLLYAKGNVRTSVKDLGSHALPLRVHDKLQGINNCLAME